MSDESVHKPSRARRPCAHCGQCFNPQWPTERYCSFVCRTRGNTARVLRRKQPAAPEGA